MPNNDEARIYAIQSASDYIENAGIEIRRDNTNAKLLWNEIDDYWVREDNNR